LSPGPGARSLPQLHEARVRLDAIPRDTERAFESAYAILAPAPMPAPKRRGGLLGLFGKTSYSPKG
jgi:hypothetical protein